MTWRKSIQPVQPSTVEDTPVEAGKIDGLLEALVISSDGTVCSNLISRLEANTERSGVLLAGAAALRELLQLSTDTPFSLTCQSSGANLFMRPISPNQLLYLVFRSEFPLGSAAYHAAQLADAANRGGLRKAAGSI